MTMKNKPKTEEFKQWLCQTLVSNNAFNILKKDLLIKKIKGGDDNE